MARPNLERVRTTYAEWALGNMSAGVELFDPEIRFESFMPDANEPVVANGPQEVARFMREFLAQWRDYRLVADEFHAVADHRVLVVGRQQGTGRQSGIPVEDEIFSLWTFREGRVVRLVFDRGGRQRALEAAGISA